MGARNPYLFFRKIGDLTTPAVAVARSAVSSISYSTDSATFNSEGYAMNSADNKYDQYSYSDNGDYFYDYNKDSDYKWSGGDGYWNSDYYGDYTYNDYTGY